ncbi:hypothetical protein D3C77_144420 [compost metagenome]
MQLCQRHPAALLPFLAKGLAQEAGHLPDIQQHLLVRIVVVQLHEGGAILHPDAYLLPQLPVERGEQVFPRLHLAPGKLPAITLMAIGGALGDEDIAPFILDDADRHPDPLFLFHLVTFALNA